MPVASALHILLSVNIAEGGGHMKSEDEFQQLMQTVERHEHQAEEEIRRLHELERQLHIAESLPRTMSADGPTFAPLPTDNVAD
jgi:hypothetical protein